MNPVPGPAKRLDGAAQPASRRELLESTIIIIVQIGIEREEVGRVGLERGEIGLGPRAAEGEGGGVVGAGGVNGSVEGVEPDASLLTRVTDLSCVPAPWPLPDTAVPDFSRGVSFSVG